MKPPSRIICIIIPLSLILFSCTSQDFNDSTKKNENWVWFTPDGSKQGSWQRLDFSDESEVFKNGKCTFFYSNGQKREEYKADYQGNYDTLFLFNLQSELTHYTYSSNNELINFIVNNGVFKAYDPNGDLALTGTVENNNLTSYQFAGRYLEFYKLIYHQTSSWRACEKYMKELTSLANGANEKNLDTISSYSLARLDSIRKVNLLSLQNDIQLLENENFSEDFLETKSRIMLLDKLILEAYNSYFSDVIITLKEGYNNENKLICQKLMQEFLVRFVDLDKKIEVNQIEISRELQINDFYVEYFNRINEEFLN